MKALVEASASWHRDITWQVERERTTSIGCNQCSIGEPRPGREESVALRHDRLSAARHAVGSFGALAGEIADEYRIVALSFCRRASLLGATNRHHKWQIVNADPSMSAVISRSNQAEVERLS